jgi:hypothetical protein
MRASSYSHQFLNANHASDNKQPVFYAHPYACTDMPIIYLLGRIPRSLLRRASFGYAPPVGKVSKRNAQTTRAIEYPVNFELIYENNALGYPAQNIQVHVRQDKCIGVDIKVFRLKAKVFGNPIFSLSI